MVVKGRWVVWFPSVKEDFLVWSRGVCLDGCHIDYMVALVNVHCICAPSFKLQFRSIKVAGVSVFSDQERRDC